MAPSSKRCREQRNLFLRQPNGRRNECESDRKSLKLTHTEKSTTSNRRWEEMNHEILICILKKYRWYEWQRWDIDFIICKSWLTAFLDVMFPPGNTLDLRLLDDHSKFGQPSGYLNDLCSTYARKIISFYLYLKLNFDRHHPNHYTKLILSECILHVQAYRGIAQRLPALKSIVFPGKMSSHFKCYNSSYHRATNNYGISGIMCGYLKNLEEACCYFDMVLDFAVCCKSIRNLSFIEKPGCRDWITDNRVEWIAKHFPLLDRLSISSFVFSFTGMSMILDSHKDLTYLDMTHTICVPDKVMLNRVHIHTKPDYPLPKDLSDKIARVKTVLTCNRKSCSHCISIDSRYQ